MDRGTQVDRSERFRALHRPGSQLRLANVWDATSARVVAACGVAAVGTTSFGVALDNHTCDGERLPWEHALAVTASIIDAVDVPVTVDLEVGRGGDVEALAATDLTMPLFVNAPQQTSSTPEPAGRHKAGEPFLASVGLLARINTEPDGGSTWAADTATGIALIGALS